MLGMGGPTFLSRRLAGLICAALLAWHGCAASGDRFVGLISPEEDDSLLYVYRPWNYINAGMAPYVYIDGAPRAALKNGGYQVYRLAPGEYSVATQGYFWEWNGGRGVVHVQLAPGQTTFLKLSSGLDYRDPTTGLVIAREGLFRVDAALASKELASTRLSD